MDTGTRGELLAANLTVDEIRKYLGVDTLQYLPLDRLVAATDATNAGFCDACLTGEYPVDIPVDLTKGVLELGDSEGPDGEGGYTALTLLDENDSLLPTESVRAD